MYDPDFAERLMALQNRYIEDSKPVELKTWQQRPGSERFFENLARLASPLLRALWDVAGQTYRAAV